MNQRSLVSSVFGIGSAVVVAVACGGGPKPVSTTTPSNDTVEGGGGGAAADGLPAGVTDGALWTCQIDDYDAQPCKFHKDGSDWKLSKLMGSQRFDGVVTFNGPTSFRLVGQFFCPWGECDAAVDSTFEQTDKGFEASVDESAVTLVWDEALAGEWGGAGYGNRTGREAE